jgi:hypothetical protein
MNLKMQDGTEIRFTTSETMNITLYFATSNAKNIIDINGTTYTLTDTGIITASLAAGDHVIKRNKSESNLFFIALTK